MHTYLQTDLLSPEWEDGCMPIMDDEVLVESSTEQCEDAAEESHGLGDDFGEASIPL